MPEPAVTVTQEAVAHTPASYQEGLRQAKEDQGAEQGALPGKIKTHK